MRILLTGATGFIGQSIAAHLLAQGHEVIGLHLGSKPAPIMPIFKGLILDVGTFDDVNKLATQLPPCDAIIHTAASLDMSLFSSSVLHANCFGIQNMLWLASRWHDCRFIFLSSVPVIGLPQVLPITEAHPVSPLTTYHASKLFGERLVHLARDYGVNGVSLRLTAPIGSGMPRNRFLPTLLSNAIQHIPLELSGTGARKQNYIDIRDIVKAVEICLHHDATGVFNIASTSCIANKELAQYCIKRCQSLSKIVFNGKEDSEDSLTWDVSIDKARDILGFVPQFNIDDSITAVLADINGGRLNGSQG